MLPKEGGDDNQKGHMLLTYYDLRCGMPVGVSTETRSRGEMRVLKEDTRATADWRSIREAIYVVDRAFMDGTYWDERKKKAKATVITRLKSTLVYTLTEAREVSASPCNEKVLSDHVIDLQCAKQQPWRLIEWQSPDGIVYQYISNDFSLEPGVIAFLYYRRWDEEKYFDNFKNDLANAKAWGKSPVAIEQQALMGIMTYVLTHLFLHRRYHDLGLPKGDDTQAGKQAHKIEQYLEQQTRDTPDGNEGLSVDKNEEYAKDVKQYDAYRAYYSHLSKITRQVWRFLKICFSRKSSLKLYQRQLKPLLIGYL